MKVTELALDPQPVLPERREVRATRDEGNLCASFGEPAAEIAANAPCPHDRDAHPKSLLMLAALSY